MRIASIADVKAKLSAWIFVDANTLIYHFGNDPKYGPACTQLIKRVELQQIRGFTSAHVVSDVAHRLMTLEAMSRMGWPLVGISARLGGGSGHGRGPRRKVSDSRNDFQS